MTVIFFAGPHLDHQFDGPDGALTPQATDDGRYEERLNARPPAVVRGFSVSGHPVSVVRAGKRVIGAPRVAAADLSAYGFDPLDPRVFWVVPARDASGESVDGLALYDRGTGAGRAPPPFSFRPAAVFPMPDGRLLCPAIPVGRRTLQNQVFMESGPPWFIDYFRVYRRNGDWVQDFPDLHGGPIHDAKWDGDGNLFIAGEDVGEDRHCFRKYNSDHELQWSVSLYDYWPLSGRAVRDSAFDFNNNRTQLFHRSGAVKVEIAPDGSFYVLSKFQNSRATTRSWRASILSLARVSSSGEVLWVRVMDFRKTPFSETPLLPDEEFSPRFIDFHVLSDRIALFFSLPGFNAASFLPWRFSVGEIGGDYLWDRMWQRPTFFDAPFFEIRDYHEVDRIRECNGLVVSSAGDFVNHLLPSDEIVWRTTSFFGLFDVDEAIYPQTTRWAVAAVDGERLIVDGQRFHYIAESSLSQYNVDPEFVRHVFNVDLSLIEIHAIDPFPVTVARATARGSAYYGRRAIKRYGPSAMTPSLTPREIDGATHFKAVDRDGETLWDGLAATARLGVNRSGLVWRNYGTSPAGVWSGPLAEIPFNSLPSASTAADWQALHDGQALYFTAHGAAASPDLVRLTPRDAAAASEPVDFWRDASYVAVAEDSPTPALSLPVFLRLPALIGQVNTLAPGLPLPVRLVAPLLRRDYVGPLAVQVYRLTLGDLEIPFSTLIARKTAFEVTVSAICPAASEPLVAAIVARDTDTLTVWRGVRFPDGTEQLDPMLRGALAGIRYDRGARSGSITLDVRQEPAATPARTRTLSALSRRDARSWSSPLPDIFLNPGDTAVVGALSFTVGSVDYLINPTEARMTVGEAD